MAVGMNGKSFGPAVDNYGAPVQVFSVVTVAGTSAYTLVNSLWRRVRVINAWGYMTGAGAATDDVTITDGTNDITDTVDLSGLGDTDRYDFGEIDDAFNVVSKDGSIQATTTSDALTRIFVMCEVLDT